LRVPLDAPFFKAGPALVITCVTAEDQFPRGPECLVVPGVDGQVDLRSALVALAARGVNDVLVEAGPSLAGAFAQQGLVDEYVILSPASSSAPRRGHCWTGRSRNGRRAPTQDH
jgi:diaminohydroxyphosphoribosylaminopyrimidine deaminase/5-amino-6-(5-phosphoribosylamino)uracil reductase